MGGMRFGIGGAGGARKSDKEMIKFVQLKDKLEEDCGPEAVQAMVAAGKGKGFLGSDKHELSNAKGAAILASECDVDAE